MLKNHHEFTLTGYTVILPSLGVGNVGQLTADLLIATLKMKKVATVWHPAIVPMLGPKAFDHDNNSTNTTGEVMPNSTTTSCELYLCESKKLAIFQLRTPLVPTTIMDDFFQKLVNYLDTSNIRQFLILTSSYAFEKHFIGASPFEYLTNPEFPMTENVKIFFKNYNWSEFTGDTIFGGGYAKHLFTKSNEKKLPTAILFRFVSEGDNRPDAVQFLEHLNQLLDADIPTTINKNDGTQQTDVIIPSSWKFMYGNAPPEQIY